MSSTETCIIIQSSCIKTEVWIYLHTDLGEKQSSTYRNRDGLRINPVRFDQWPHIPGYTFNRHNFDCDVRHLPSFKYIAAPPCADCKWITINLWNQTKIYSLGLQMDGCSRWNLTMNKMPKYSTLTQQFDSTAYSSMIFSVSAFSIHLCTVGVLSSITGSNSNHTNMNSHCWREKAVFVKDNWVGKSIIIGLLIG